MKFFNVRRICAAVLCAGVIFALAGCKEVEEDTSFKTPNIPETTVEVTAGGSVNLPAEFTMPTEVGTLSTGFTGSEMFGGFTLISSASTSYFTTTGTITINFNASLFRMKNEEYIPATFDDEYKNVAVALYKKEGNDTVYIKTAQMLSKGETQTATFSGLDSTAEYRFVITYTDVSRTRATGTFSASGITSPPEITEGDDSTSDASDAS